MSRGVNYEYECIVCEVFEDRQVPYLVRDEQFCTTCENPLVRQFPTPGVTRASYVDGTRRKGWAEMREASKLNREAAGSMSTDTKREIAREIRNKLRVDITK